MPEIVGQLEAFFSDPAYLMERYADAYENDAILNGHLFEDLNTIERWMEGRNDDDTLALLKSD